MKGCSSPIIPTAYIDNWERIIVYLHYDLRICGMFCVWSQEIWFFYLSWNSLATGCNSAMVRTTVTFWIILVLLWSNTVQTALIVAGLSSPTFWERALADCTFWGVGLGWAQPPASPFFSITNWSLRNRRGSSWACYLPLCPLPLIHVLPTWLWPGQSSLAGRQAGVSLCDLSYRVVHCQSFLMVQLLDTVNLDTDRV